MKARSSTSSPMKRPQKAAQSQDVPASLNIEVVTGQVAAARAVSALSRP
jgi:hypothetical protein